VAAEVAVAVSVMDWPKMDGFGDEVMLTDVWFRTRAVRLAELLEELGSAPPRTVA
jgi:hypothetical protein